MESYQALYYPYIHFKDDAWVKLSALYWDKVHRIVPHGYATHDSETVKRLGAVISTLAPDGVHPSFGDIFLKFILAYAPGLQEQYSLKKREQWPAVPENQRPPKAGGASGRDERLGYIYNEKIDLDLILALQDCGLAQAEGPWIGMHPRLAWVYMTALAEQIASERGLRPLTDETRDHVAISSLSPERLAQTLLDDTALVGVMPTNSEIEGALVSVAFRAVVPTNLAALDVDKILAFREKYPQQRIAFQRAAAGLLGDNEWLKSIYDPKILEQRLRDEYDKQWGVQLQELREQLNEVGIESILSCFNVKAAIPAGIVGAAAAMSLPFNPIAAGAATVAVGVIAALRDKRKAAQDAMKSSPMTYLYRMEQDLAPTELWDWVRHRVLGFGLGA